MDYTDVSNVEVLGVIYILLGFSHNLKMVFWKLRVIFRVAHFSLFTSLIYLNIFLLIYEPKLVALVDLAQQFPLALEVLSADRVLSSL
jgi:hypothetical protein